MPDEFLIKDRKERKRLIHKITDGLKKEYSPITPENIEQIAKDYGNVKQIIKTPLVENKSCLLHARNGGLYIFHWETLPGCERFNLAHETGHSILHSEVGRTTALEGLSCELEADLFATRLCDIPRLLPYLYQYTISSFAEYGTKAVNLFRRNREIDRLKELGVFDVLVYNNIIRNGETENA